MQNKSSLVVSVVLMNFFAIAFLMQKFSPFHRAILGLASQRLRVGLLPAFVKWQRLAILVYGSVFQVQIFP